MYVLPEVDLKEYLRKYVDSGWLSIIEVELDLNNCRHPLLPYRTDKGALIYRSGTITGVYNSVDFEEALNDGAVVVRIIRGIYWKQCGRVYHNMIENFYDKRAQLKKEGNAMEYVLKILLNSTYGKNLEAIDDVYKFNDSYLSISYSYKATYLKKLFLNSL